MNTQILQYQSPSGNINIGALLEDVTVWLTQTQLCELFQKSKATISEHIRNLFEEGELDPSATVRKFRTFQLEGSREVEREVKKYRNTQKMQEEQQSFYELESDILRLTKPKK
jgi:hypothetical protein